MKIYDICNKGMLHSVSAPKQTKLGTGRFWEIEVRYTNQRGEVVGTELYTGYGYRREVQ